MRNLNVRVGLILILALLPVISFAADRQMIMKESFIKRLSNADTPKLADMKRPGLPPVERPIPSVDVYIKFRSGSAVIADAFSENQLDELGAALLSPQLSPYQFKIIGHTDSVGSESYNLELSKQRAQAVFNYLVQNHEIQSERILVEGAGEYGPIASNDTEIGRKLNRRIVIKRVNRNNK